MGIWPWLARSLASAFLLLLTAAPALAQGIVEGNLQLGDERVPITHVYARETRQLPGSDQAPHVVILMTDRPAPPEIVASRQAYNLAAMEGRIRGALLVLQPEPRFVMFAPHGPYVDTGVPDVFDRLTLAELRREDGRVSGHLLMSEAGEMADFDEEATPTTYRVDLRFSAPIAPAQRPSAELTGEAARGSPQAAMALLGLQIIRTGSAADVRAAFHPDHPMWTALGRDDIAAAMLEAAREVMPAPDTFLQSIERVLIYDDDAIVFARDPAGVTRVSLRRDGDAWKFARGPIAND